MQFFKKSIILLFTLTLGLSSCNQSTEVVESGTYTGEVVEVEPAKTEIYVQTDQGKLELYFTDETELIKEGEKVNFAELSEGDQVEVKVEKVGKRLDPLEVKILP